MSKYIPEKGDEVKLLLSGVVVHLRVVRVKYSNHPTPTGERTPTEVVLETWTQKKKLTVNYNEHVFNKQ